MNYQVTTDGFEGPLGLLLSLIESRELDISQVSLGDITEDYVKHLEEVERVAPTELADFLVIASKLLYMKSKLLLPDLVVEDEDELNLADQLRMYRKFAEAAEVLAARLQDGRETYFSVRQVIEVSEFAPPEALTGEDMARSMNHVINRLKPYVDLPKRMMERRVSIEEKITHLKKRIRAGASTYFHEIAERGSRSDTVASFLALLELLRMNMVNVKQKQLFEDIAIEKV